MINTDKKQQKAIEYKHGNVLVIAGPGSGKTSVLTKRICYLIQELHVDEKQILVLTFTRAAATEMKERFLLLTDSEKTSVTFGTFHSVFLSYLKNNDTFRDFRIIEHEEERKILELILKDNNSEVRYSSEYLDKILGDISRMKNGLQPLDSSVTANYEKFSHICKCNGVLTFDDILLRFFDLLLSDPVLLKNIRQHYKHILVDEFQDINRIQYEILKLISGKETCMFAVGDDDQSIYGFRGSDPGFMKLYRKEFRHCGCIVLNNNYRSTGMIVSCSSVLIRNNRKRFRKNFKAIRRTGMFPIIKGFPDMETEAKYIMDRISDLETASKSAGLKTLSFAVLARTNEALDEIRHFISEEYSRKIEFRTFHSSKGLEYDAVFISHADEDVTPGRNSESTEKLEEERRVFYVAMTRCKSYLHIFYTSKKYNTDIQGTRFISELKGSF